MSSTSSLRLNVISILDALIWYAYLVLLFAVSFVNNYYSSQVWLLVSACAYTLCGLCVLSAINGGRCNWYGLGQAKFALMILVAILVLLILQTYIPVEKHTEVLLFDNSLYNGVQPSWFNSDGLWSVVPRKTRWLFNSEALIFTIFALSIALLVSRRRLRQLLLVMLLVGFFHSLVGIGAKYSGLALVDLQQLDGHFSAARAWFINRNHYAAFVSLCLLGPLAFQMKILITQSKASFLSIAADQITSYRLIYPLALGLGMVALVLSQSRAGFLAFLSMLALTVFYFGRNGFALGLGFNRRRLLAPVAVAAIVVIAYFGSELALRFSSDALLGERIAQWSITWEAIKHAWLLGYGGNSYADVFQVFRGYEDFRQVLFNQSHNDYLHIWLEQGLLGLMLWLGFLVVLLRAAHQGIVNTTSSLVSATLICTIIVILAALLQSAVDFNLQILNIRYYFFVIISLAYSVPAIRQRKGTPTKPLLV